MNTPQLSLAILFGLAVGVAPALAQNAAPATPQAGAPAATTPAAPGQAPARGGRGGAPVPTRDPHNPAYPEARELPDGTVPTADDEGNFIIGPTHNPAPEMTVKEDVPHGVVSTFEMKSTDSKIYPGIARAPRAGGPGAAAGGPAPAGPASAATAPAAAPNPATSGRAVVAIVPMAYTRKVAVYVPKQYVPGTIAPFIVGADGPDQALFTALDNLIAEKKVPVMIAISIANGGGDAQGSERGLEYDTMSGLYAEFVEKEVLPMVEQQANVKLSKNPDSRATMGGSSGGSAALEMAWYHPDLYHRVLTYSGTYVNQQSPYNAATPHGAWNFHETLIPNSPVKPIRLWMEVGDRDNISTRDDYHDWTLANENMAKVLTAKKYHYQFIFARNAGHTDRTVKQQTLPLALEWIWKGYKPSSK